MRKGYEYDDNIYNENEGGTPQIVCFSKEEAKQRAKDMNINEYRKTNIGDYSYEYESLVNCSWDEFDDFNKSLIEKYGPIPKPNKWGDTENLLHPNANNEEVEKYHSMVSFSFYDVCETDIDIASWRNQQINSIVNN